MEENNESQKSLTLIKKVVDIETVRTMFNILAEMHADLESRAHGMLIDLIQKGIHPSELRCDGAFLQLGLAEEDDTVVDIETGMPVINPIITQNILSAAAVKKTLMGDGGDCDCEE